mgnify:CR=1 FL=1
MTGPFFPYFPQLYLALSLIALGIATYTDIRERIVPNRLELALAIGGLLLKIIESFGSMSPQPLLLGLAGCAIAFGAGYLLYRLGVWAGGDVKLVAAIALLNPLNYAVLEKATGFGNAVSQALGNAPIASGAGFFGTIDLPIFGISLIIHSALAVLPIGFFMSLSAVFRHKEVLAKTLDVMARRSLKILGACAIYAFIATSFQKLLEFGAISPDYSIAVPFLTIAIIFGSAFLAQKIRDRAVWLCTIAGLALGQLGFTSLAVQVALPLLAAYAVWTLYTESRKYAFRETIPSKSIAEGMVPDAVIVERKGKIELSEPASVKSVINQLMDNKVWKVPTPAGVGRVIFSPSQAGGLSESGALEIRALAAKGKIPDEIRVRKTMAFVPAMLLGYIALQLTGDVLWKIMLSN